MQAPANTMPNARHASRQLDSAIPVAVRQACSRIAPSWPLDRFIAVNPWWQLVDQPIADVSERLNALAGVAMTMPPAWYIDQYRHGAITDADIAEAIALSSSPRLTPAHVVKLLESAGAAAADTERRSLMVDVIDKTRDITHHQSWRVFVVTSISQHCAAYFDEGGQSLLSPDRTLGLYGSWRLQAGFDHSPSLLMGAGAFIGLARQLPESAIDAIAWALGVLAVPADELEPYLHSLLLSCNGWASWCAYRAWIGKVEAAADGAESEMADLLAIRLCWEALLLQMADDQARNLWASTIENWRPVSASNPASDAIWIMQHALEIHRQRDLRTKLAALGVIANDEVDAPSRPALQAVFCIDVRSEVLRRALEACAPGIQTIGFAGFFGMPIEYQPIGTHASRPQLPGLLSPAMRVTDAGLSEAQVHARQARMRTLGDVKRFRTVGLSSFPFVEALGLTFAWSLVKESFRIAAKPRDIDGAGLSDDARSRRGFELVAKADGSAVTLNDRVALAAGMLRGMSIGQQFARILLLAGHGSQSRNNPHASGLDCGACCGQSGEVNARLAAALLNDPQVRRGLALQGIVIPADTWVVAGLHNTTTEDVTLYDLERAPASHRDDLAQLQRWLAAAADAARRERSAGQGAAASARQAFDARAQDWAQTRPEWGLAGNWAFVAAPRGRTAGCQLDGQVFLHEYRAELDSDGTILQAILTAPVIVAHWINMQYYASTVDQQHYGSGNKVLHNVVGGHIGVFEGNSGDLRIGLSRQSLHDGRRWMHDPRRLSVFVEAGREAIQRVIDAHPMLQSLLHNGWLHLFQIEGDGQSACYTRAGWLDERAPM